jgi:Protein of unknown function (DUF4239)
MSFYWLYDIPGWALFTLVIGVIMSISLAGAMLLRQRFDRWLGLSEEMNDLIGHFLSFTGAFYGIMLGLVAVGAWETFDEASTAVDHEAANMAALYYNVIQLPAPTNSIGASQLRSYAKAVITEEWPAQRLGERPTSGDKPLTGLGLQLGSTVVGTGNDQLLLSKSLDQFNTLMEARRARLQTTKDALPASLWAVILLGALINISMTWLLTIRNKRLDLLVNILMALTLGSVLSFIIAMDNPYRGELSVGSDAIEDVYLNVMQGDVIKRTP